MVSLDVDSLLEEGEEADVLTLFAVVLDVEAAAFAAHLATLAASGDLLDRAYWAGYEGSTMDVLEGLRKTGILGSGGANDAGDGAEGAAAVETSTATDAAAGANNAAVPGEEIVRIDCSAKAHALTERETEMVAHSQSLRDHLLPGDRPNRASPPAGIHLVALGAGGFPLGTCVVLLDPAADTALLKGLCVMPEHRGTGVGARLVQRAKEEAGKGTVLIAAVAESATAYEQTGEFYVALGFTGAGAFHNGVQYFSL